MKTPFLLFSVCVLFDPGTCATSTAIPELLLGCYRSNFTAAAPEPPLTIRMFVELMRKIEMASANFLSLRTVTTTVLHALRLDGVVRSPSVQETSTRIPYRASGDQFYRYKLLVDYLTSGESGLFPSESLSGPELCLLHEMISSTIDPWERGDEAETCIVTKMPGAATSDVSRLLSGCPEEKGVAKTKWGTVSPGHLIAGAASAMEETFETLQTIYQAINVTSPATLSQSAASTRLSNVWAATVAGDLAEVVVYQATEDPTVGNQGYWNDTVFPRLYMSAGGAQEMTDAEMLGGMDGAIIASKIKTWLDVLSSTRFSQIVDMYYSSTGVGFNTTYKSCNRLALFRELLLSVDLAEQVRGAAGLLQVMGRPSGFIPEDVVAKLSDVAVERYIKAAEKKSVMNENCEYRERFVRARLEVIAILDATWDGYKTRQLITELVDAADVSFYGSKLGIINGETGSWLTNVTSDVFHLFEDLDRKGYTWPATLSLTRSLHAVISHYQNRTNSTCVDRDRPEGKVVLVLAPTSLVTDADFESALASVRTIKNTYPETTILYVTGNTNGETFQKMSRYYRNDYAMNATVEDAASVADQISERLKNVAGHVLNFYCGDQKLHFEDYVTPGVTSLYELHEKYLLSADTTVRFKGNDYGDLTVCAIAQETRTCRNVQGYQEVVFRAFDLCEGGRTCPVRFEVDTTGTKRIRCAETDCRYPDQVRLDIYAEWTTRSGSMAPEWSVLAATWLALTAFIV